MSSHIENVLKPHLLQLHKQICILATVHYQCVEYLESDPCHAEAYVASCTRVCCRVSVFVESQKLESLSPCDVFWNFCNCHVGQLLHIVKYVACGYWAANR